MVGEKDAASHPEAALSGIAEGDPVRGMLEEVLATLRGLEPTLATKSPAAASKIAKAAKVQEAALALLAEQAATQGALLGAGMEMVAGAADEEGEGGAALSPQEKAKKVAREKAAGALGKNADLLGATDEDGNVDEAKAKKMMSAKGKERARQKLRDAGFGDDEDMLEAVDEDGIVDKEKAKKIMTAKGKERARQKLREKGFGDDEDMLEAVDEDGNVDVDKAKALAAAKAKARASGFIGTALSKVGGMLKFNDPKYEKLKGEFLEDTELDGLEEGLTEIGFDADEGDPWSMQDRALDKEGATKLTKLTKTKQRAEQILQDATFKQIMYDLSYHYYTKKNTNLFVVPMILLSSLGSFLSFASTAMPEHAVTFAYTVGTFGAVTTIMAALRQNYALDTRAEMYRAASAEYKIIVLELKKRLTTTGKVSHREWEETFTDVDRRVVELQKKVSVYPPDRLIRRWQRSGLFTIHDGGGASARHGGSLPPWCDLYEAKLKEDGITSAEMIEHISEETFFQWELEKVDSPDRRYPPIVVKKLISLKAQQKELKANPGNAFGSSKFGIRVYGVEIKQSTQEAFRKRGVEQTGQLRLCSDRILDSIVTELISRDSPPFPDTWLAIEEAAHLYKAYGDTLFKLARYLHTLGLVTVTLTLEAEERVRRVNEADRVVVNGEACSRSALIQITEQLEAAKSGSDPATALARSGGTNRRTSVAEAERQEQAMAVLKRGGTLAMARPSEGGQADRKRHTAGLKSLKSGKSN
mmetsp:Transcript_2072/g.4412  ORF Transcript_2072/g.4412 Transcript_2072/m.4412 type:complete len:757 (+) Transcript_2072:216-2486(+)